MRRLAREPRRHPYNSVPGLVGLPAIRAGTTVSFYDRMTELDEFNDLAHCPNQSSYKPQNQCAIPILPVKATPTSALRCLSPVSR